MKFDEIKKMNNAELEKNITAWRKELFDLRLSAASTHIKDNSQFKKLRQNIARALTCLSEVKTDE